MKNNTRKVSSTSKTRFNLAHENMLYNVVTFALSASYIGITQSIAAFNTLILLIQSKLQTVDSLRAITRSPITGYASQKKAMRAVVVALSGDIMNAAYAFAIDNNNQVLAKQMLNNATELDRLGYRQLIQYINGAITNLNPYVTGGQLTSYGVTSGQYSGWQVATTGLAELISNPKNAIASRVSNNKTIYMLMNECMFLITNNCDTLVNQFRVSNPDYYNNYCANRRLNEHHLSTQLRIHVADVSGNPVTTGEVFIIGTDRNTELNNLGYGLVNEIPFGTHQVTITTPAGSENYGPYDFKKGHSLTLHVTLGEFTKQTTSKVTVTETVEIPVTTEK